MRKRRRTLRTFRANGRRFRERMSKRRLTLDGNEVWGFIDYVKGEVVIDKEASEETLLDTRIHEFTHGFFDAGRQRLLHEDTVERFATELRIYLWRHGYRCPADEDWQS